MLVLNDGLEMRFGFSVVLVPALGAREAEELDEPELAELAAQEVDGVEEKSLAMGYISFTGTSGLVPKARYLVCRGTPFCWP